MHLGRYGRESAARDWQSYWGFAQPPFSRSAIRPYVSLASHDDAATRLVHAIESASAERC